MPRMKPDDLEAFLRQPFIGVLATPRRDGRPYTVPVWWLLHDGSFWLSGTYERAWCKQIARDPRASLCIEATGDFAGHVGLDGRIVRRELPDFDIWPISRRLAARESNTPFKTLLQDAETKIAARAGPAKSAGPPEPERSATHSAISNVTVTLA